MNSPSDLVTLSLIQYTFPFLGMISINDPFDCPLASIYDPSYPLLALEQIPLKEAIPKVEEPTSPGYHIDDPASLPPETQLPLLKLPKPQKTKKISKQANDDDYKPYRRPSKGRGAVKQKQDRNLIPNTMHHLLAFVQKQFKSAYLVEKMLPRITPSPAYTVARFYNFHRMLRAQVNNYVNEDSMRTIVHPGLLPTYEYGQEEQDFYCRLSRVVIKRFLKVEAVLMILLSRKVRRENILDHLSVQRFIYQNMRVVTLS